MLTNIKGVWKEILKEEQVKEYFIKMNEYIIKRRGNVKVFPRKEDVFRALTLTPFENVKVVIIGQDPYYIKGAADGLAFSSRAEKTPRSLKNIYQELFEDLGIKRTTNDLTFWAKQGVLLLNTILTVEETGPLTHENIGWEIFTKRILEVLSGRENIVYLLFGNNAKQLEKYVNPNSIAITTSHPSPFSARISFFGSKVFSQTNKYLNLKGLDAINW